MYLQYQINYAMIEDYSRFQFRATMIDTARHFLPLQIIMDHLVKNNYEEILHPSIIN